MRRKKYSRGLTLLEVVVAVGIGAIVLFGVSMTLKTYFKSQKRVETLLMVESVRNRLRLQVDCKATLAGLPAACTGNRRRAVVVKGDGNETLVRIPSGTTVSTLNDVKVRAFCLGSSNELEFEFSLQSTWRDLFTVPFYCSAGSH